jgi:hypothetical protein
LLTSAELNCSLSFSTCSLVNFLSKCPAPAAVRNSCQSN